MATAISKDGTRIGFDREGQGPPVLLVDGALCSRDFGPMKALSALLAQHFTVYRYDRRGRGESGDTQPWSIDREVEDLAAIVREAGEPVFVYGISSGAVLSLEAASRGVPIRRLALYEAPFMVDDTRPPLGEDYLPRLKALVAANRRADAVRMFMKTVGVPAVGIFMMRLMPVWKKLTAVAHTLPYDIGIVGRYQQGRPLPASAWPGATMPALVMDGGKSPAWLRNAQSALARALPQATTRTLPGQTHNVSAAAVAPSVIEFFA
jgi:pimeloyl-ACP methyl ester carboxylesterase